MTAMVRFLTPLFFISGALSQNNIFYRRDGYCHRLIPHVITSAMGLCTFPCLLSHEQPPKVLVQLEPDGTLCKNGHCRRGLCHGTQMYGDIKRIKRDIHAPTASSHQNSSSAVYKHLNRSAGAANEATSWRQRIERRRRQMWFDCQCASQRGLFGDTTTLAGVFGRSRRGKRGRRRKVGCRIICNFLVNRYKHDSSWATLFEAKSSAVGNGAITNATGTLSGGNGGLHGLSSKPTHGASTRVSDSGLSSASGGGGMYGTGMFGSSVNRTNGLSSGPGAVSVNNAAVSSAGSEAGIGAGRGHGAEVGIGSVNHAAVITVTPGTSVENVSPTISNIPTAGSQGNQPVGRVATGSGVSVPGGPASSIVNRINHSSTSAAGVGGTGTASIGSSGVAGGSSTFVGIIGTANGGAPSSVAAGGISGGSATGAIGVGANGAAGVDGSGSGTVLNTPFRTNTVLGMNNAGNGGLFNIRGDEGSASARGGTTDATAIDSSATLPGGSNDNTGTETIHTALSPARSRVPAATTSESGPVLTSLSPAGPASGVTESLGVGGVNNGAIASGTGMSSSGSGTILRGINNASNSALTSAVGSPGTAAGGSDTGIGIDSARSGREAIVSNGLPPRSGGAPTSATVAVGGPGGPVASSVDSNSGLRTGTSSASNSESTLHRGSVSSGSASTSGNAATSTANGNSNGVTTNVSPGSGEAGIGSVGTHGNGIVNPGLSGESGSDRVTSVVGSGARLSNEAVGSVGITTGSNRRSLNGVITSNVSGGSDESGTGSVGGDHGTEVGNSRLSGGNASVHVATVVGSGIGPRNEAVGVTRNVGSTGGAAVSVVNGNVNGSGEGGGIGSVSNHGSEIGSNGESAGTTIAHLTNGLGTNEDPGNVAVGGVAGRNNIPISMGTSGSTGLETVRGGVSSGSTGSPGVNSLPGGETTGLIAGHGEGSGAASLNGGLPGITAGPSDVLLVGNSRGESRRNVGGAVTEGGAGVGGDSVGSPSGIGSAGSPDESGSPHFNRLPVAGTGIVNSGSFREVRTHAPASAVVTLTNGDWSGSRSGSSGNSGYGRTDGVSGTDGNRYRAASGGGEGIGAGSLNNNGAALTFGGPNVGTSTGFANAGGRMSVGTWNGLGGSFYGMGMNYANNRFAGGVGNMVGMPPYGASNFGMGGVNFDRVPPRRNIELYEDDIFFQD